MKLLYAAWAALVRATWPEMHAVIVANCCVGALDPQSSIGRGLSDVRSRNAPVHERLVAQFRCPALL